MTKKKKPDLGFWVRRENEPSHDRTTAHLAMTDEHSDHGSQASLGVPNDS